MLKTIRNDIISIIGIDKNNVKSNVKYNVLEVVKKQGYTRQLIEYFSRNEKVPAYLLIPDECDNNPAVLIHHQHNREHHLGKSEICGLAGNPLQAFGVELVKKGYVVLAPDSICFEKRRNDTSVIGFDLWQHLNEMSYGILNGECIMKKVLEDNDRDMVKFLLGNVKKNFEGANLTEQKAVFEKAGFEIMYSNEAFNPIKFYDIGALVWFARIISWEFVDFSVDRCFEKLLDAQKILDEKGVFEGTTHRYVIVARKLA